MCSFGEIVEPGSRNAWEDWDENNDDDNQPVLKWQQPIEKLVKINTFLLLEGRYLADTIGKQVELKFQLVNSVPGVNLKMFRMEDSGGYIYICVLKEYNLLQSSEIVELIKPLVIISDDIVTILTKPLVEYQVSELVAQEYVIRSISTSKPGRSLGINLPRLEQPNIISGVSAGTICLRENLNLSGLAVVCYIEHTEEIQQLQQLLEKLNIVNIDSKPNSLLKSNLYI